MANRTITMNDKLYDYLLSVSLNEPQILASLREVTQILPDSNMQISPEQGQFLGFLLQLMNAKTVLEIGTYTGYSALVMALALPEEGRIITCDINEMSTSYARSFWQQAGVEHKITLKLQPAQETLEALLHDGKQNSFDFVFIDANKTQYKSYFSASLELLRVGGVIAIDNTLLDGKVADKTIHDAQTNAIREFNRYLHGLTNISLTMLPVADGLTLVRKLH